MACPNRNRKRPRTVAFRLTDEEFMRLDQRVKIAGEVKGDYLRAMALEGEINISVGKYKSDKLAIAIGKLKEELKRAIEDGPDVIQASARKCQIMIEEVFKLVT
jgi:hypothetical protein